MVSTLCEKHGAAVMNSLLHCQRVYPNHCTLTCVMRYVSFPFSFPSALLHPRCYWLRDRDLTSGDDDLPVFRGVCEGAAGHGDSVLLGGHAYIGSHWLLCTILGQCFKCVFNFSTFMMMTTRHSLVHMETPCLLSPHYSPTACLDNQTCMDSPSVVACENSLF